MGITKAEYQQKKNKEAVNALKALALGIERGELDVEFTNLRRGLEMGVWMFRCQMNETEKYGKKTQLSEVS